MQSACKKTIPDSVLQEVIQGYQSGMTHRELFERWGRQHNVSEEWLRKRMVAAGVKMRPRGQPHGKYLPNGGRTVDKSGYILVKVPHGSHPHANDQGYVREHRLVMEQHLGRLLSPREVVHHKNGVKSDNRIENLELFESHHKHFRHELQGNQHKKGKPQPRPLGDKRLKAKPGQPYWTKDKILEALKAFQQQHNRPIRRVDFRPPHLPSYTVANREFGHWSRGVWLALGYDPLESYPLAATPQERGICD